jgi:hypothetical protein
VWSCFLSENPVPMRLHCLRPVLDRSQPPARNAGIRFAEALFHEE